MYKEIHTQIKKQLFVLTTIAVINNRVTITVIIKAKIRL